MNSSFQRSQLGTPSSPQRFDAYLSTMSGDLWVTSGNCTQCNTRTVFNKSKSDTFQAVQYSIGQPTRVTGLLYNLPINGDLVQDTVAIGLDPALQVQNQTWGLMDDINAVNLTGLSFRAGVMGFGFNSSTAVTPFWQSLLQANLLQAPEMGFWLRRRGVEPGGVLNLGGRDPSSFTGDVEFYQLVVQTDPTQPTYWRLNVSGTQLFRPSPLPYPRPFSHACLNRRSHSQQAQHPLAALQHRHLQYRWDAHCGPCRRS